MRLREITETRQLNEVAPLAFLAPALPASLAWISTAGLVEISLWALSAYSAWATGKEIENAMIANGPNPADWPQELQDDLLGQIIGTALFSAVPALKSTWQKVWGKVPSDMKRAAFQKIKPKIEAGIAKKDPNRIERPYSKDAVSPANSAGKPPKNPNLIDRPYQKEQLLRLAGLAK